VRSASASSSTERSDQRPQSNLTGRERGRIDRARLSRSTVDDERVHKAARGSAIFSVAEILAAGSS
jgi:hypothetical protein